MVYRTQFGRCFSIFMLCKTSNPGAGDLQDLIVTSDHGQLTAVDEQPSAGTVSIRMISPRPSDESHSGLTGDLDGQRRGD